MNIFVLHESPIICAQYHCDKHVVKMVIEYSQILAGAHRLLDGQRGKMREPMAKAGYFINYAWVLPGEEGQFPRVPFLTHPNHPCIRWAMQSSDNYWWLFHLYQALCREFAYRYGHGHGASRWLPQYMELPANMPQGEMTPFPSCMPEKYASTNAVDAYRSYYLGEKMGFAKWKTRPMPPWVQSTTKVMMTDHIHESMSRQPTLI